MISLLKYGSWLILTAIIMSGCAASYTPIVPEKRKYTDSYSSPDSSITYAYKYDVLSIRGNKRYSKKEKKAGLSVLAVRIQNNTNSVVKFSNLKIYLGNREVIPVDNLAAANNIKQSVIPYLLYCLLGIRLSEGGRIDNNGYYQEDYIVIPIGIPIAAGNLIGAGAANTNLRREFVKYDMMPKSINPHETLYGIMVLQGLDHQPVRFELIKTSAN